MKISAQPNLLHYPELDAPPRTLLGPGPSTIDPRVLRAQAAPVVGHLDPTFLRLMDRTQELLRYVFQTENELTLTVPGTGSAAMEAAVANLVEPGDAVLVCVMGYFGARLVEMAKRCGGQVETITRPFGEVFSPEEIGNALERRPTQVVALVHGETSAGTMQPLEEIAKIVRQHGALLIVDAVTSLGGTPLSVREYDIDACYSCAQKCLGAPPGVSPLTISARAAAKIAGRREPVRPWYLDLGLLQQYWGKERAYHHTAPISGVYAFYECLRLTAEEGLEARWERHRQVSSLLADEMQKIGLELHVAPEHRLPPLTTVRVPAGVDEAVVRRRLLDEYNIEIGGGLGELKGKVWRVGLMGYSAKPEYVVLLTGALDKLLNR